MGLAGRGKRGGARTILCFKKEELALFMYGYSKKEMDNPSENEIEALREYAKGFLELSEIERAKNEENGFLIKILETN